MILDTDEPRIMEEIRSGFLDFSSSLEDSSGVGKMFYEEYCDCCEVVTYCQTRYGDDLTFISWKLHFPG